MFYVTDGDKVRAFKTKAARDAYVLNVIAAGEQERGQRRMRELYER